MSQQQKLLKKNDTGASFSKCGAYRYTLWRSWAKGETCLWVMLNPSTADDVKNDPTVERCERRTRNMDGFGKMVVCNLFAFRATDSAQMKEQSDPVGPDNDKAILAEALKADRVVCAWGNDGGHLGQSSKIVNMFREKNIKLNYLKLTAQKEPGHPLYIGYDQDIMEWEEV